MNRDVLKSRPRSESEKSVSHDTTHNHLEVSALFDLLEERKLVRNHQGLVQLAERYGVDLEKLENVARYVNTPSIDEGTRVKRIGENGEETVTMSVSVARFKTFESVRLD
jgi:crotonobetainyl-CoA:carnitine CoA-transferase CaiB-like acyl-CoA transferase